jgi:hypothetical protein
VASAVAAGAGSLDGLVLWTDVDGVHAATTMMRPAMMAERRDPLMLLFTLLSPPSWLPAAWLRA